MNSIGGSSKSESLFKALYNSYVENDEYNIFVAKRNGERISALLVLYFNKITEYYTPVTAKGFRELQPLALVIYEAIRYSVQRGCTLWNWAETGIFRRGL